MKVSAKLLVDAIYFVISNEVVQNKLNPIDAYTLFTSQKLSSSIIKEHNGLFTLKVYFDYASYDPMVKDQDVEVILEWSYPRGFRLKTVSVVEHAT